MTTFRSIMLRTTTAALVSGTLTTAALAGPPLPQATAVAPAVSAQALAQVKPALRLLDRLPAAALAPVPAIGDPAPLPTGRNAKRGAAPDQAANNDPGPGPAARDGGPGAQNYGVNNLNTIYHYTDSLVPSAVVGAFPNRTVGLWVYTKNNGTTWSCTATLISRSILVTAGHCVHNGGGGQRNYIRSGTFYPAYNGAVSTYGYATSAWVITTSGWYNTGSLDRGYDVGLVVLNKRAGTATEIGAYTGWMGFCHTNCLQPQWYNTQIGYPGNYYSGRYQTQGQHHQRSDGYDYVFGSGMLGGSSGGPQITNLGSISDSSGNAGQYAARNQVFAVTSWGYTSNPAIKLQGASPLSGPNNSNNFKSLYNTMCKLSRQLHGTGSCALL